MQERRQPEIIAGGVDANGVPFGGSTSPDWVCIKNAGTGSYSLRFPASFRYMSGSVTPLNAANTIAYTIPASGGVDVQTLVATTSAGQNAGFTFIAVGVQT